MTRDGSRQRDWRRSELRTVTVGGHLPFHDEATRCLPDRRCDLPTYLQAPGLTRGGLRGVQRGWIEWPARTDSTPSWPDTLIVREMRVAPLVPGVVHGMYRYRGINQGKVSVGIPERVFAKTRGGWRISYTASFPDTLPP